MSGYLIQDAFPDTALQSGRVARKEERKRAKQCNGPALAFLKGGGEGTDWQVEDIPLTANPDLDRQPYKRTPLPNAMGGYDGFTSNQTSDNKKWIPKPTSIHDEEEKELVANLVGQQVNDIIGLKSQQTLPKNLPRTSQLPDTRKDMYGKPTKSYFGKGLEDSFADFSKALNDNPGYTLTEPMNLFNAPTQTQNSADFLGSFGAVGLTNSQGKPFSATPSVNDAWKPLTSPGARTSFYEYLPPPAGEYPTSSQDYGVFNKDEKTALLKKLDTLFARLEEIESKRNENSHTEISLFVLSGLFLIYGIDAARRL
jgi:hypothetical protein